MYLQQLYGYWSDTLDHLYHRGNRPYKVLGVFSKVWLGDVSERIIPCIVCATRLTTESKSGR